MLHMAKVCTNLSMTRFDALHEQDRMA